MEGGHPPNRQVRSLIALVFGPAEAELASDLYRALQRPRGREIDLAIAAHAILQDATLWTLNTKDFTDIPGLELAPPFSGSATGP